MHLSRQRAMGGEMQHPVLRQLAAEVDRNAGQQLESGVKKLYGLVSSVASDRASVAMEAASVAEIADRLAQRMVTAGPLDQTVTLRLLKNISGDADYVAAQGERSAEQAAMVLDSLFVAYSRNARLAKAEQVRTAIRALFQQLDDPSAYNAPKFAQQMRVVNGLLR